MREIKTYFGIDFGTTNSAAAGIIETGEGESLIEYSDEFGGPFPSLVAVDRLTGETCCGRAAWQQQRELSESCEVISSVKSFLGTDKKWNIGGKIWTPEMATAEILTSLKKNIKENYGAEIDEAVISVPVGFSSGKRKALRKAAEMAGISIKSFVSEPTSAIFRNYDRLKGFSKIAVFDWGGGTLDVSVVENKKNRLHELAVDGMPVGGDYIDYMLARWIHARIIQQKSINVSFEEMPRRFQDMMIIKAEMAKRTLSDDDSTSVTFNRYGNIGAASVQIDIDTFYRLIEPVVDRALSTFETAVKNAGMSMEELECILVVGGSSNLRLLIEKIEDRWGDRYIEFPEDSEWNAAQGAALLGINPGSFRLNQKIGLVLSDGSFFRIKGVNETIPCDVQFYEFGVVEDSKTARFLFTDGSICLENGERKILGYENVPVYGFTNETVKLGAYVDKNLVFRAIMKSDHMPDNTAREFELTELKFYYNLP